MKSVRPWKRSVVLVLVSASFALLVAGAIGEAYIRLARPYSTPETLRQASLEYEATLFCRPVFPQAAQSGLVAGEAGLIAINRRGYRGRDFDVPKPDGVTRIVVLGGSAGFDVYAPEGRDWPHLVEKKLRLMGHDQVEVINARPCPANCVRAGSVPLIMWCDTGGQRPAMRRSSNKTAN